MIYAWKCSKCVIDYDFQLKMCWLKSKKKKLYNIIIFGQIFTLSWSFLHFLNIFFFFFFGLVINIFPMPFEVDDVERAYHATMKTKTKKKWTMRKVYFVLHVLHYYFDYITLKLQNKKVIIDMLELFEWLFLCK